MDLKKLYRIEAELGTGGTANVYRAIVQSQSLNQLVVLLSMLLTEIEP